MRRIDKTWSDLGAAVDRLADDQGRVARNNARRAVMQKLKRMRALLDEDFPVTPKKRKPRNKIQTEAARHRAFVKRMERLSYIRAADVVVRGGLLDRATSITMIAAAGVKVHQDPTTARAYVPIWVAQLWQSPAWAGSRHITAASVRRVKNDRARCAALESEWRLSSGV